MTSHEPPSEPATSGRERLHYMDAARCILLLLGVVIHAANVYVPAGTWLVRDEGHEVFWWISEVLHLFRIPTFFIIAGFFAAFTLPRYPLRTFLRVRMQRLAIPFIAAVLLLNLPQVRLLQTLGMPGIRRIPSPLPADFWLGAEWIFHLWFLLSLMVFIVATVALLSSARIRHAVAALAARLDARLRPTALTWAGTVAACALAIVAGSALVRLVPALDRAWWWIGYPQMLMYHATFFVLGAAIGGVKPVATVFLRPSATLVATSAVVLALTPWMLAADGSVGVDVASKFAQGVGVVLLCQWTLIAFRTFASAPSALFRYLSDASYSVYLFHHFAVMLVAAALLGVRWSPFVKFPVVVVVAFAVSLALHHFGVLRSPLLRLLFNGKTDVALARRHKRAAELTNA